MPPNDAPPRSEAQFSSSRENIVDLAPPADDAKKHPNGGIADQAMELNTYNPLRAEKCISIGDYYFHQKNYVAAESRYQEALAWKEIDAEANFKLGVTEEKLAKLEEARKYLQKYLKLSPQGIHVKEVNKLLERIDKEALNPPKPKPEHVPPPLLNPDLLR